MESLVHVLEAQQFSLSWIGELFRRVREMRQYGPRQHSEDFKDKVMVTLFWEASTRTRDSFEMAMLRQGGRVIPNDNARTFSSAVKGESLEHTLQVISGLGADVIVLRYDRPLREGLGISNEDDLVKKITALSEAPVINAGDGNNQHPTQSLTDFFTIQERIAYNPNKPMRVGMVGDLANGRTVRSLSYLLAKFSNVAIYFVSPPEAAMKDDIKDYLTRHRVPFFVERDLYKIAPMLDVLYVTRVQIERGTDFQNFESGEFVVTKEIAESMPQEAIIMHPMPMDETNPEISREVWDNKRAFWLQQSVNSLYIRKALLQMILSPNR